MDNLEAILTRRSCRDFLDRPVESEKIEQILTCATYAPSPANKQPWEFIVTQNPTYNQKLRASSEATRGYVAERSGWKWIPHYKLEFITQAPVLLVILGDPAKNGAEQFLNFPTSGYEHACAAAAQNICLAAHSLGLGTLWLSFFEKDFARELFHIEPAKDPFAIICLGYPARATGAPARRSPAEKTTYLE